MILLQPIVLKAFGMDLVIIKPFTTRVGNFQLAGNQAPASIPHLASKAILAKPHPPALHLM